MGLSVWHWLILLVVFGSPLAMYFLIASGARTDLKRPLTFLHRSFWVWVIAIVAAVIVTLATTDPDTTATILGIVVIAIFVAGWSYLMALAILANRTGRNGILWAGLTFITSPIGVVVSYPLMISALREQERGRDNAA